MHPTLQDEIKKTRSLDRLSKLAHSVVAKSIVKRIKGALLLEEKSPGILSTLKVLPADIKAVNATASLFVKSLLLGIDHSLQKKEKSAKFDDTIDFDDIEILPFEEALEYMQKRLPMSAEEYYKLSDKARFRAFTVARLTDGDSLKKAKSLLEKSIAEGGTLTDFLKKTDTELLGELGLAGTNGGWYWENVYRTNVQTAYNTGRAIGFENVKPLALELVGIGDSRQTELCRSLTQPPVRRPYGDEFWERYWPPLHFSCRTTVRAIYDPAELEEEPITNVPDGIEKHRAKGFGTYPIDSDTWWDELPSMKRRAVAYGVQGEIEKVKVKLELDSIPKVINPKDYFDRKERIYSDMEDLKAVNPKFSPMSFEYSKNCQRCVATWEMRKRGFNVTALPAKKIDKLYNNWAKIFNNLEYKLVRCKNKNILGEIEEQMKKWEKEKTGTRAIIYVAWEKTDGHVFVAEQKNGKTFFYDPQNFSFNAKKHFKKCIKSLTMFARIDTLSVTDLIFQCCRNL